MAATRAKRAIAAIYLYQDARGIWVYDQWQGQPVHKRLIRFEGGSGASRAARATTAGASPSSSGASRRRKLAASEALSWGQKRRGAASQPTLQEEGAHDRPHDP